MLTTIMSSKGQIIIPKAIRESCKWSHGTRLEVHETAEGILLKPVLNKEKVALAQGIASIRARISYCGPKLKIEDMDKVVSAEAALRKIK